MLYAEVLVVQMSLGHPCFRHDVYTACSSCTARFCPEVWILRHVWWEYELQKIGQNGTYLPPRSLALALQNIRKLSQSIGF